MKKLTIEYDINEEIEYTNDTEFGVNCIIVFNNDVIEIRYNCSEVHYLYKSNLGKNRVAFESDIHETGGTLNVDDIKYITVVQATKLNKNY